MVIELFGVDVIVSSGFAHSEGAVIGIRLNNRHVEHMFLLRVGCKYDGFVFVDFELLNGICIKSGFTSLLNCSLRFKTIIFSIYNFTNHFIFDLFSISFSKFAAKLQ